MLGLLVFSCSTISICVHIEGNRCAFLLPNSIDQGTIKNSHDGVVCYIKDAMMITSDALIQFLLAPYLQSTWMDAEVNIIITLRRFGAQLVTEIWMFWQIRSLIVGCHRYKNHVFCCTYVKKDKLCIMRYCQTCIARLINAEEKEGYHQSERSIPMSIRF